MIGEIYREVKELHGNFMWGLWNDCIIVDKQSKALTTFVDRLTDDLAKRIIADPEPYHEFMRGRMTPIVSFEDVDFIVSKIINSNSNIYSKYIIQSKLEKEIFDYVSIVTELIVDCLRDRFSLPVGTYDATLLDQFASEYYVELMTQALNFNLSGIRKVIDVRSFLDLAAIRRDFSDKEKQEPFLANERLFRDPETAAKFGWRMFDDE